MAALRATNQSPSDLRLQMFRLHVPRPQIMALRDVEKGRMAEPGMTPLLVHDAMGVGR